TVGPDAAIDKTGARLENFSLEIGGRGRRCQCDIHRLVFRIVDEALLVSGLEKKNAAGHGVVRRDDQRARRLAEGALLKYVGQRLAQIVRTSTGPQKLPQHQEKGRREPGRGKDLLAFQAIKIPDL